MQDAAHLPNEKLPRNTFLAGGGEMGSRIRAFDWTRHSFGAPEGWPAPLKTAISLMLGSAGPAYVAWGDDLTSFYNDGYLPFVGDRHPALGQPSKRLWSEIWAQFEPIVAATLAGDAQQFIDLPVALDGRLGYFTFAYTPLRDEAGHVAGFFCAATETTDQVLSRRAEQFRLALTDELRELSDPHEMMDRACAMLGGHLEVAQVGFAETEEDQAHIVVHRDWNDGRIPSVVGRWRMDDFGPAFIREMKAGKTIVIGDIRSDARTNPAEVVAAYEAIRTRAILDRALIRDGCMRAMLFIHHPEPRRWTPDEVALVEEVTERLWAAVERSRAEAAIGASERRFRTLARATPGFVWYCDADGAVGAENPGFLEFTGTSELAAADAWLDTVHPADRARSGDTWMKAVRSGAVYQCEYRQRRADGAWRWMAARAVPVRDEAGAILEWIGTSEDVTDRRQAIDALRKSEEQFRTTAEAMPGLLFVAGADGANRYVNEAFRAYTGRTTEDLLEDRWGEIVHEEDLPAAQALTQRAAETGEPYRGEYRFRRFDGQWRWHEVHALPVRGSDGAILEWVGTCTDVHDRRTHEEDLQKLVAEAVQARSAVQQQLFEAQKVEAIGQLTGGIAHDFNNLLTPIVTSLELVARRLGDDAGSVKLLNAGLEAAERARVSIQRLLAFARRQTLQPCPLDVESLVGGMRDLIVRSLGPTIAVSTVAEGEIPAVMVDPNHLELALLNLCVNARDAMPEGGGLTIAVSTSEFMEGQHGLAAGRYVGLTVTDTGAGMDSETLGRAVEPFFTTKSAGEGTGLGLSMVHGLAAQSGGAFVLESTPGAGVRATIWLPVARDIDADGGAPQAERGASPLRARSARILLVDDEALIRFSTGEALRELGYEVVEAADADSALARVQAGLEPDVVITDHLMPGQTGLQLAQELRGQRPDLPVILMTGYAYLTPDEVCDLEVIPKPFRDSVLADRVARLLARTK